MDGLLVSYHPLITRAPKYLQEDIEAQGIHKALDYDGTILGDCGAFSYVYEYEPPYSPSEVLRYYEKCSFDIGATLDHLIWKKMKENGEERQRRYNITLRNARIMYKKWKRDYQDNFELLGVAQGWDPQSYADAVEKLIDIGFYHIGVGGVAGASSKEITPILTRIYSRLKSLKSGACVHLFGVNPLRKGSSDLISIFKNYGVSSFDTSIMLRQAWRRTRDSYLLNNHGYTAIRVPTYLEYEVADKILQKLRDYADYKQSAEDVMRELRRIIRGNKKRWIQLYKKTLLDRPWEKCGCKICEKFGVDVIIFRGNERNMRRGFHNVFQFYNRFIKKRGFISPKLQVKINQ